MEKTELIYTDQKKFDVLIAERQRFANELNEGIQYLKTLDFVSEVSIPDPEDPIGWWHNEIIQTVRPKTHSWPKTESETIGSKLRR